MSDERREFTFHSCLGRGGFGEVYAATMQRPGGLPRRVAVKILRNDIPDIDGAARRLRNEGKMLALIDHPAIVHFHDLAHIDGSLALIMEHAQGLDISRVCTPRNLLPPRIVIAIIREVAGVLWCAWNMESPTTGRPLRLVHRDIKPANILISTHGMVKLLDFGIARSNEIQRDAWTAVGQMQFTPGYAAPETLIRGEQTHASDIFSLGATLYRMISGDRLFQRMKLPKQREIMIRSEPYEEWLVERIAQLDCNLEAKQLMGLMLRHSADMRPTAEDVEAACDVLFEVLDGPQLAQWTDTVNIPEPRAKGARLTGRAVVEDPWPFDWTSAKASGSLPLAAVRAARAAERDQDSEEQFTRLAAPPHAIRDMTATLRRPRQASAPPAATEPPPTLEPLPQDSARLMALAPRIATPVGMRAREAEPRTRLLRGVFTGGAIGALFALLAVLLLGLVTAGLWYGLR